MNSKSKLLAPELVNAERPVWAFSKKIFCEGMRDGVPIALGYFAVSFSLGIAARRAGFTPFQGFLVSLLNNASAGEYAAFAIIMANATYLEVAIITLIANARYLLMSCALARRRIQFWQRQCRKHGMHRPAVCRDAGNRCSDRGRKLGPEPCDGHHKTGTLRHPVRHHSAGHPALFKRLRAENAVKFPYRTKIK